MLKLRLARCGRGSRTQCVGVVLSRLCIVILSLWGVHIGYSLWIEIGLNHYWLSFTAVMALFLCQFELFFSSLLEFKSPCLKFFHFDFGDWFENSHMLSNHQGKEICEKLPHYHVIGLILAWFKQYIWENCSDSANRELLVRLTN